MGLKAGGVDLAIAPVPASGDGGCVLARDIKGQTTSQSS